jgi:glutaredoxin
MDPLTVYYRPGCPFAVRLRARLTLARIPHRSVAFPRDPGGAAAVRGHTGGYETSPTVRIGETYLANPSLHEVRQALAAIAPQHVDRAR